MRLLLSGISIAALTFFTGCGGAEPFDVESVLTKAVDKVESGELEEAMELAETLNKKSPNNVNVQLIYGLALERYGNKPNDALNAFKKAAKLDHNNFYAYYNLGRIYLRQTNYNDSVTYLRRALEIDHESINAKVLLAEAYSKQQLFKSAINLYEELATTLKYKDDSALYNQLGILYTKDNDLRKGYKNFVKSYQKNPKNHFIVYNLAVFVDKKGKPTRKNRTKAIIYYKKYQSLIKNNPEMKQRYDEVSQRIKELAQAL